MKNWSKLAMSAGAIGVIGVAGSFGTFSAFTAAQTKTDTITTGTIRVSNDFQLPDWHNLGTSPTDRVGHAGGTTTPEYKKAGSITVKNTGSLAQDVYLDFDGPGVEDQTSPNLGSTDVLADNIIMDSSLDADFSALGDEDTRLYKVNRRGPSEIFANLQPGEQKTIYFRVYLRERLVNEYPLGDNEMQNKSINEKITVSAVEAGRDDLQIPSVNDASGNPQNWDFGN